MPEAAPEATKGKGKGYGPAPGPPPANAKPKAKAKPLPAKPGDDPNAGGGIGALQERVQASGEAMDKAHGMEIGNVDLSKIDPEAKGETFVCQRCELKVLVTMRESHMNSHSAEIRPWLFLGAARNADNAKELTVRTGITHILNVAHETNQDHDAKKEWEDYNKAKGLPSTYIKYSWVDLPDQDIVKEVEGPVKFVHKAHAQDPNNKVLVHCVQGISRSACVVLCYLMKHENMTLRSAYEHVQKLRTVAQPRREFFEQLGLFECKLFNIEKPTLTAEEVYANKTVLNVDG